MAIRIYTGSRFSDGARTLAASFRELGLDCKVLRTENSRWRPRQGDTVINWGASRLKDFGPARVINSFQSVATAVNKISTFEALEGHRERFNELGIRKCYPVYARDVVELVQAMGSFPTNGIIVRTTLTGHSGQGTYYFPTMQHLVNARINVGIPHIVLAQEYIRKDAEYRIHVMGGEIIDVQKKRRASEAVEDASLNPQIRSHANGWVYCRENVNASHRVRELAVEAVAALGLDFGAVDIMTIQSGAPFVLEVNSAPGLSESTGKIYAESLVTFL